MTGRTAWVRRAGVSTEAAVDDDGNVLLGGERVPAQDLYWRAPPHGMLIGCALNLKSQLARLDRTFRDQPYVTPPRTPVLFIKPENTVNPHRGPVALPPDSAVIQPGAALGIVMGRRATRVAAAEAMGCVKGYTLVNDFALPEQSFFRPPVAAKCFDGAGAIGPYRVDAARLPAPAQLELRTFVNGALCGRTSLAELAWGIPALIEFVTGFMTLSEDDILFTGLPDRRVDVGAGDEVAVEADGLGRLVNRVIAAGAVP